MTIPAPKRGSIGAFGSFMQLRCDSGYFFNPQPPGYVGQFRYPSYQCQGNKWIAMNFADPAELSGPLDCMSK